MYLAELNLNSMQELKHLAELTLCAIRICVLCNKYAPTYFVDLNHRCLMTVFLLFQVSCDVNQRRIGQYCFRLDSVEELMCVAEEAGGKYRVRLKVHE